tara:strand:- start:15473 stop:15943 length:471 start_codon:yes stop_codon:yes gene_type:complete
MAGSKKVRPMWIYWLRNSLELSFCLQALRSFPLQGQTETMPPSCEVTPSYDYACPVLHIKGEFTQDMEKDLEEHYLAIPAGKRGKVVLDFSETQYINSSGIAILIALITRATDEASSLEFAGLSAHFKKVMEIVGLDDFVTMHETLDEAVSPSQES